MISHFKKITLAVALGASALAVAAPAEAQSRGGYRGRDNGGAVVAGIAGLAVGAAIASSIDRPYGGYYYDQGYDAPVVAYPPVYDGYYAYRPGYNYRAYNGYYPRGGYDRYHGGRDHRGNGYRR